MTATELAPHVATCNECPWQQEWPTKDEAGYSVTWHVHDEHPLVYLRVIGERPPRDPKPDPTRRIR